MINASRVSHSSVASGPKDFPAKQMGIGELAIITVNPHFPLDIEKPVIRGGNDSLIFPCPTNGRWSRTLDGYRVRKLREGERVIFEAAD